MIGVFPGKASGARDAPEGTLATGYAIGEFAVDAPEGVHYPGSPLILLTHAHCDHICGLALNNLPYACSEYCARAIAEGRNEATLCSHLGLNPPRRPPREILGEGRVLEGEGFSIEVIETPGHAKGALCFYVPQLKALFSGDTVFGNYSLPALTLPTGDPGALLDSYEKLAKYEIEKIFPGHGTPFRAKGYIEELIPALHRLI